jgi:hypothetical protein
MVSKIIATSRPYSFAATTQPPATSARLATSAKVAGIPMSIGSPWRKNGRSAPRKRKEAR